MKPEVLIVAVPIALFSSWLIIAPRSATRFYERLYQRTHPRWYPQVLRIAGVVILIFMVLIFTGVLK